MRSQRYLVVCPQLRFPTVDFFHLLFENMNFRFELRFMSLDRILEYVTLESGPN